MDRIGEPYVTSKRRRHFNVDNEVGGGLGLGFFIAKTLLERSGATLTYENRTFPQRGANVQVRWDRGDFDVAGTAPAAP
jgi:two-component system sensor histidine kinase RegB